MSIHERIKSRRQQLGLSSHQALADLVGVTWQTVQLWEKEGGTAPNRNRIQKVAEVLGVTAGWLQNGDEAAAPRLVAGGAEPTEVKPAAAPEWMDADAYRLLDFYYSCDVDGRNEIMSTASELSKAQPRLAGIASNDD